MNLLYERFRKFVLSLVNDEINTPEMVHGLQNVIDVYRFVSKTYGIRLENILSFSILYTYNSCFSTLGLAGRPRFRATGFALET